MYKLFLFIIVALTFTMTSCEKEILGCTDQGSLNYNPEANMDNGTCFYVSNRFSAVWTGQDTCISMPFGGVLDTTVVDVTFAISPTSAVDLVIDEVSGCLGITARAEDFSFTADDDNCIKNFAGDVTEDGLILTYSYETENPVTICSGKANREF